MSQETQLGHATGSGKKTAVELDLCFTYYFPLLEGFGWKTSSVSYVFAVFPACATEKPMFFVNVRDLGVQGHVGIPVFFRWGSGSRWMIFGGPFRGHLLMIFGVGMISYIYTPVTSTFKGCQLNAKGW